MSGHRFSFPRGISALVGAALIAVGAIAAPIIAQSPSPSPFSPEEIQAILADPTLNGPDVSVHYVGMTSDPNVYVAVVDDASGSVSVYLCDGDQLGTWFEGTVTDGAFEAASAGGETVVGTIDGSAATGTATMPDGSTLDFTADLAVPPAGFYDRHFVLDGQPTVSRTIQLSDGTAKGQSKASNCERLLIKFEIGRDAWQDSNNTTEGRLLSGKLMMQAFREGQSVGCGWTNWAFSTI